MRWAQFGCFSPLMQMHRQCGDSRFDVCDGTQVHSQGNAASATVTVTSVARALRLRILANRPTRVTRDGVVLPNAPTAPGWNFDGPSGFLEVQWLHPGGTTAIHY